MSVGSQPAAGVDAKRPDLANRIGDVRTIETPGEKNGDLYFVANAPTDRPIVSSAGAAQLFDCQLRMSRIEQNRVHFCGHMCRLAKCLFVANVDNLHD